MTVIQFIIEMIQIGIQMGLEKEKKVEQQESFR